MSLPPASVDAQLDAVIIALLKLDPTGARIGSVLRSTLDQLYDGQRTGRYRWEQLHKTEKTHCGTLVEINLHREFDFDDGDELDYKIAGNDVDCKYSQTLGGWMIPPEAHGKLCLLVWANDQQSEWNVGLVRAHAHLLGRPNRDGKCTLNPEGRLAIHWLYSPSQNGSTSQLGNLTHLALLPNILLQLPANTVDGIMSLRHGTQRLNQLFTVASGMRVGRGVVATVAKQDDYMKRVRENGGSRTALRPKGIIILGQFGSHVVIAKALGVPSPMRGESVSVRVYPATQNEQGVAMIEGGYWRKANAGDTVVTAPKLPSK